MVDLPHKGTSGNKKKRELKSIKKDDNQQKGDDSAQTDEKEEKKNPQLNVGDTGQHKKKKRRRRRKKKKKSDTSVSLDFDEGNLLTESKKTQAEEEKPKKKRRKKKKKIFEEKPEEEFPEEKFPEEEEFKEEEFPEEEEFKEEEEMPEEEEFKEEEMPEEEEFKEEEPEEKSIWDKYDEGAKKEETIEEKKPEESEKETVESSTPSAEEADVPDWLKAVPSQQWKDEPESTPSTSEPQPPFAEEEYKKEPVVHQTPEKVIFEDETPKHVEAEEYPYKEGTPVEGEVYKGAEEGEIIKHEGEEIHEESPVVSDSTPKEPETESFIDNLKNILLQAGISLKSLLIWIFITLIVIIAGYFTIKFVIGWIGGIEKGAEKVPVSISQSKFPTPSTEGEDKVPAIIGGESYETGLSASEKLGYWVPGEKLVIPGTLVPETEPEKVPVSIGVSEGASVGDEFLKDVKQGMQQQILTLREMQNAFNTDIYELMDKSRDRYTVLTNHINLMILLEQRSRKNMEELKTQIALIKDNFDKVTAEKQVNENNFFTVLRDLNPLSSDEYLTKFITFSKIQVELKANYNARQKILRYHELLLENLENRRRDYELNQEALVKGVKVIDVKGSDIKLILSEE